MDCILTIRYFLLNNCFKKLFIKSTSKGFC